MQIRTSIKLFDLINILLRQILSHNPFECNKFNVKLIVQVIYTKNIQIYPRARVHEILILLKNRTKANHDIVNSLCANLLHILQYVLVGIFSWS